MSSLGFLSLLFSSLLFLISSFFLFSSFPFLFFSFLLFFLLFSFLLFSSFHFSFLLLFPFLLFFVSQLHPLAPYKPSPHIPFVFHAQGKKAKPLDLRKKLTRAKRRALTRSELNVKSAKDQKKARVWPVRKFAVMA